MPRKTKKPNEPNAVQLDALKHIARSPDGRLIWMKGGFWTCRGIKTRDVLQAQGKFHAPAWSVATLTVRAMERNGWIERTNTHAEDWKDERALTALGRAFVFNGSPTLEGLV